MFEKLNITTFKSIEMFYFTLIALVVTAHAAKFPKNWVACKKDDPAANECLKGAIQGALVDLSNGSPALGVFPLDPMHFNAITIDQGSGPVSIKLDFIDLDVIGFKNFIVDNVENDWKDMTIALQVPKITIEGKYKIKGKVLVLPISGDGDCKLVLDNFKGKGNLKLSVKETGSKKHYHLDSFKFTFNVDHLQIRFDNLFNGDKALGDNMNVFLNENWNEILGELKPAISQAFGAAFKDVGNRVFSKIEADAISP